ncbi:MAG: ribonuclease [Lachnospiraceae bacterium]|nr:ribonuclease [Lachnospiraceae bacterium]MCI8995683.1 ribonuclease [Lachnospiraceae bacterium]MCI9133070.1 ribonuclease [Lachnospiraceae bacterium]
MKKQLRFLLVFLLVFLLAACKKEAGKEETGPGAEAQVQSSEEQTLGEQVLEGETKSQEELGEEKSGESTLAEDGSYTSKEDVALYIHLYGHLPDNFITKKEAEKLGWEGGFLEPFAPGKCIGGSRFGNYEGLLPEKDGRTYTECDIDTLGAKKRGAKRIVFSNDGLVYYTEDHYESFELLYGEE